jgi:hypothetical protein
MGEPRKMDLAEFRNLGYLQEVNRLFLHRLGLAMYVTFDDEGVPLSAGVLDDREDPEGWVFKWDSYPDGEAGGIARARFVRAELEKRREAREALFGASVQPFGDVLNANETRSESDDHGNG